MRACMYVYLFVMLTVSDNVWISRLNSPGFLLLAARAATLAAYEDQSIVSRFLQQPMDEHQLFRMHSLRTIEALALSRAVVQEKLQALAVVDGNDSSSDAQQFARRTIANKVRALEVVVLHEAVEQIQYAMQQVLHHVSEDDIG
jgi:hypothetical protein